MYRIKVAATSANLGPGFDSLGLALNLYNSFIFKEVDGLELLGFDREFSNKNNLVYLAMKKTFEKIEYEPRGVRIEADIQIPISRGLGSSASCIVAGIIGASLLAKRQLDEGEILDLAVGIEGHADNVAGALLGGLVVSLMDDELVYSRHEVGEDLIFLALVPDYKVSTQKAREVLPEKVDFKEVLSNISRVSLLMSALLEKRYDLLKYALVDKVHEPYRKELVKDYDRLRKLALDEGALGVYLSGAGPTIMCLLDEDNLDFKNRIKAELAPGWQVLELRATNQALLVG